MSITIPKATKEQEDYMFAKAWKKTLESTLDDFEKEYIIAHNITNGNGSVPAHFYNWDAEDETSDKAVEDFYSNPDIKQICELKKEADELFDKAEDALIDFAIAISPSAIQVGLRKASKIWKYRKEIVKTALCLDPTTIPKELRRFCEK